MVGYIPWGLKESDTTERLTHTHISITKTRIFKTDNSNCWRGGGTTETHSLLVGVPSFTASLENSLAVS